MILVCAGTRPNFIKAAPVIKELKAAGIEYELIKIGQHNDYNMSDSFLEEFGLLPYKSVDMKGTTHADQTATAMMTFDRYVQGKDVTAVVVFGDCNASLSPALVASKRSIPIAHIEAGVRGNNREMPEEINRILIDSISDILFAPSIESYMVARTIGNAFLVGDVMYDLITEMKLHDSLDEVWANLEKYRGRYYFCTLHRAYNVDDKERLGTLLEAIGRIEDPVICPIHPRLDRRMKEFEYAIPRNVIPLEPVTYRESLSLQAGARKVITDSGGVQKEAYYLGRPCAVLRSETEWAEINNLVPGKTADEIFEGIMSDGQMPVHNPYYFGGASKQIANILGAL